MRISFSEALPLVTFLQLLTQGASAGAVGFAVYFGTLFLMREENVYDVYKTLHSHLFKIKSLPKVWGE
ncbi:MAG: hypothetical protein ACK4NX_02835 [Candidatus Paceibacteria bacterium]